MADEQKAPGRAKGTRTTKPVYVIMQVRDNDGSIMDLTKENVEIISVHKDAGEVLEALDGGALSAGTFYKRVPLS
tara:strand:+ start:1817 stop:2041 length:225 start_codon:yes stop_codon:yes gene_type:complete